MVSEPEGGAACRTGSQSSPQVTTSASHRLRHVLNSDIVKDGISSTDNCSDVVRAEIRWLSTVLPTLWIGAQNGWSVNLNNVTIELLLEN